MKRIICSHFAVPVLRLRISRAEDFQVPFAAAPGFDDLGGDDVHQNFGEGASLRISLEMIGGLLPPEVRVEHHRQEQIVAVVDDDDLTAGALDGRMIDEVLLSAVRADIALERELARDNLFDCDFLFPAVAAIALLTARFRYLFRAAERTFGFCQVRLTGGHGEIISAGSWSPVGQAFIACPAEWPLGQTIKVCPTGVQGNPSEYGESGPNHSGCRRWEVGVQDAGEDVRGHP